MIVIGYSGHSFVVIGVLRANGVKVTGYCDAKLKEYNPFQLEYFGDESSERGRAALIENDFFISIGDNRIRRKIYNNLEQIQRYPITAIHPSAIIDETAILGNHGIMISSGVIINSLANIGDGVICNTGSIIEHECIIDRFAHIGPGAVLCGNVSVGEGTFVGAGSVVRQGIKIGKNVMIGAGSVVVKDVEDNQTVMGNPSKIFIK